MRFTARATRFALCFFAFAAATAKPASALAYFFDFNGFYLSDSSVVSSSSSASSKMTYEATLGVNIDKKGAWMVGWNYGALSFSDTVAGSATTYSSTQMGPKFYVFFDKPHSWFLAAAYNLVTKATYQSGSSPSEAWAGTAYSGSLGYQFEVSSGMSLGLRLTYSAATYSQSAVGATYKDISDTRSVIYPAIGFMGVW